MSNTESNLPHTAFKCFVYGDRPSSVWLTNDILLVVDYTYTPTCVRTSQWALACCVATGRISMNHIHTQAVCLRTARTSANLDESQLLARDPRPITCMRTCRRESRNLNLGQNKFSCQASCKSLLRPCLVHLKN
jgi:hypothetical protein